MPDQPLPPAPMPDATAVREDPWRELRRFTPARIGLGRAGTSLPTAAQLELRLAHSRARDAVARALDVEALQADIRSLGLGTIALRSAAGDRATYLRRPDLGRSLDAASLDALAAQAPTSPAARAPDLSIVVADGLSAQAAQRHAEPLLRAFLRESAANGWSMAPVAIVTQGRVAVGDAIGERLRARIGVVLIGERPGLSSPDSLGVYVTGQPRVGRSDAERNCISNVRPEGLPPAEAARRLAGLLAAALRLGMTGVGLKDLSDPPPPAGAATGNFLLGSG